MIFDLCNVGITIKITIFHFLKKISFLGKNDYFLQSRIFCNYWLQCFIVKNKIFVVKYKLFFRKNHFFFEKMKIEFHKIFMFLFFRKFVFFRKKWKIRKTDFFWKFLKKTRFFRKNRVFLEKIAFFSKIYGSHGVNEKYFIMQKHDELFRFRRIHVKA